MLPHILIADFPRRMPPFACPVGYPTEADRRRLDDSIVAPPHYPLFPAHKHNDPCGGGMDNENGKAPHPPPLVSIAQHLRIPDRQFDSDDKGACGFRDGRWRIETLAASEHNGGAHGAAATTSLATSGVRRRRRTIAVHASSMLASSSQGKQNAAARGMSCIVASVHA
jgi:hypothetical protein